MSYIFDGVPGTETESSIQNDTIPAAFKGKKTRKKKDPVAEFVFHEPYKERDCASCHDKNSGSRLLEPQPDLCFQCHDDFREEITVLHGPVAGGYCTSCHEHHLGKNKKLLRRTGRQSCLYCHQETDVMANDVHDDTEDADCIDCHGVHGGEDRTMIL